MGRNFRETRATIQPSRNAGGRPQQVQGRSHGCPRARVPHSQMPGRLQTGHRLHAGLVAGLLQACAPAGAAISMRSRMCMAHLASRGAAFRAARDRSSPRPDTPMMQTGVPSCARPACARSRGGRGMVEAAVSAHVKRAAIPSGPMLPAARAGALSMMQDDDVRMDDLATLIRADPGLTLVLLRAANSAASASRRRIEDTRDALVRIGLQATKRVVAAAVVGEAFQNMDECGIDEDAFWAHSLATAVICESSVTTARLRPVAFSAGLLHDVGRLVLGASLPEVYGSLSDSARREPMVLGAEAAIFGEDHAKAGGRLLSLWGVHANGVRRSSPQGHEPRHRCDESGCPSLQCRRTICRSASSAYARSRCAALARCRASCIRAGRREYRLKARRAHQYGVRYRESASPVPTHRLCAHAVGGGGCRDVASGRVSRCEIGFLAMLALDRRWLRRRYGISDYAFWCCRQNGFRLFPAHAKAWPGGGVKCPRFHPTESCLYRLPRRGLYWRGRHR